jgi:HEAT repeat protein
MNLLTIVIITAEVLTLLSLVLLAIIVILRLLTEDRLRHEADYRRSAENVLSAFLEGKAPLQAVSMILLKDRACGLKLLMERSNALPPGERPRLDPVFRELHYVHAELSGLKSPRWQRRLRAAERLGYLGDDDAIPSLMTALRDDAISIRFAAAGSLARLGCHDAVEPILNALDLPGEVSQRRVTEVISGMGKGALDPLIVVLESSSGTAASLSVACRVAGILRDRKAIPPLLMLIHHEDREVRLNAVRALASIGDSSVTKAISCLAEDPSWEVRSIMIKALGRLRASDHTEILLEALSDPEWWVRQNAAQALLELGEKGVGELRRAADHHVDAYGRDISRQILRQHGLLSTTTGEQS